MTQGELDPGFAWALVGVLGVGTFLLRLSFIQLYAWLDEFPPWFGRALAFVPPAILAALVFPALFSLDGSLVGGLVNARSVAAGVATYVAWRTGSMMATIAAGMAVLWTLLFVFD